MSKLLLCVAVLAALLGVGSVPAGAQNASPAGPGAYWLVAADGGIFAFGGVPFQGSTGAIHLNSPIIGMAPTPDGDGYWLLARDGGVFGFGDAKFMGSLAGLPKAARPSAPAVAIASSADGGGYWVATADGSVYAFGDAPFAGSLGGRAVAPVVAMAASADGRGYWLATATGGIYTFGDARFHGSVANLHLARPIVGLAATPDGGGYWLVASDGGVFTFGTAGFAGSTGAIKLNQPIVGMAASPDGGGYWLVASDGGIFAFGDAPFRGSTGGKRLNQPIVGMAVGHTLDPYQPNTSGFDISWPQCGETYPAPGFSFAVVGINNGRAFTHNPCLSSEAAWAGPQVSAYINLNAPPQGSTQGQTGPAGTCVGNNTGCIAYNFGYNAAVDAFAYGSSQGVVAGVWWLDVETANSWDSSTYNNARTIQGALDALQAEGVVAGIYSTHRQFTAITGPSYLPGAPIWKATGADVATAQAACSNVADYNGGSYLNFGGGTPWLTQYGTPGVPDDQDWACPIT